MTLLVVLKNHVQISCMDLTIFINTLSGVFFSNLFPFKYKVTLPTFTYINILIVPLFESFLNIKVTAISTKEPNQITSFSAGTL